jgi:hypothetical protein
MLKKLWFLVTLDLGEEGFLVFLVYPPLAAILGIALVVASSLDLENGESRVTIVNPVFASILGVSPSSLFPIVVLGSSLCMR